MCTRRPRSCEQVRDRRRAPGTSIGSAPSRRSSVAQTTSPGSSPGAIAGAHAGDRDRARVDRERPRRRDRARAPAPCPCAARATSGCAQRRLLDAERREQEQRLRQRRSPRIAPERHHREDVPVQVVVQVEVAREAGARVLRLVPAAARAAASRRASRPRARRRARGRRRRRRRAAPTRSATRSTSPRPRQAASRYERRSSPKPPSAFCTRSSHATAARTLGCAAHAAGGERGHDGAGAVEVVRAPAAEPRAVALLLAQQVVEPARASAALARGPRSRAARPCARSRRRSAGR